jgi:hypothetical protein
MMEEKRGPESPRNRAPGEGEEEDINGPAEEEKKRKERR